ncbi:hypothetical protein AGOR_G00175370 [Albula goreensis]|uniref:Uncharacterized protein n=1 Tax=Albula goreensis TaxID=1534307 RepID=A0A8T3CZE0_9TELE|nr:hypothetical protein AGOR_G00175370 [Albula goreensis]
MFALLSNLKELNQTDKLDSLAELGSGAEGPEESSGAGAPVREAWPEVSPPSPATPAPQSPALRHPSEKKLESQNDIPERPPTGAGLWRRGSSPQDTWARQLEEGLDGDGLIFSGNGFTELETRHDFLLRSSSSSLQADLPQAQAQSQDDEEDIFQAQGYLPYSPQTVKPTAQAGAGRPVQTQVPQGSTSRPLLDSEGSGLAPPLSVTH